MKKTLTVVAIVGAALASGYLGMFLYASHTASKYAAEAASNAEYVRMHNCSCPY